MLSNILLGIAAVIVLFVLVVASRPATFHVERSITIAAPAESAFKRVNDFHAWTAWSPYEKIDPQMKRTFEGPASGTGAIYAWAGTGRVGEGRMTIEKSDAPSQIAIKLEFFRPFTGTNAASFRFVAAPEGTKVTWAMDGQNNFLSKAFSLFMDQDKMVGTDFESGLAALKGLAESDCASNVGAESGRSTERGDIR